MFPDSLKKIDDSSAWSSRPEALGGTLNATVLRASGRLVPDHEVGIYIIVCLAIVRTA